LVKRLSNPKLSLPELEGLAKEAPGGYGASKAALTAMARLFAKELRPRGVRRQPGLGLNERKCMGQALSLKLIMIVVSASLMLAGCASMNSMTELYPSTTELQKIKCLDPPLADEAKYCEKDCERQLNATVAAEQNSASSDGANICSTSTALLCAENTRMVDEDFVMCREKRQLILGAGIALLAAGAGGAAVAGNDVAAVATGSVAGAGLGLDFATYNSAKGAAFGTAATQLDCVVRQTLPAKTDLIDINRAYSDFDGAVGVLKSKSCAQDSEEKATKLYSAEREIAERQRDYARGQVSKLGLNIYAAVRAAQIAAYAGSQNGVPTPALIQQGVQSMSMTIPTPKLPTPTGKAPAAAAAAAAPSCTDELTGAEKEGSKYRASLARLQLPDPLFQQCLSSSAQAAGTSKGSAGQTSKSGSGGKTDSGNTSDGSTGDQSDDAKSTGGKTPTGGTPTPGPTGGGTPTGFTVEPVTNNVLCIDNSAPGGGGATLKVTGGTPPYYFKAVEPAYGLTVSAPEVRLDKTVTVDMEGRVLVADQAGNQQVIYVWPTSNSSKVCPEKTSTPGNKGGAAVAHRKRKHA
jgi:hypothetical protein